MNKERIQYAISIMEQAKNLYMNSWQSAFKPVATINELHFCGNTACFAGYLALSPLFKEVGGAVGSHGHPILGDWVDELAVLAFFETDERYRPFMEALTLGHIDELFVGLEEFEQEDLALAEASETDRKVVQQVTDITGGLSWEEWEPKHVITVLKDLLDGEFDWLLED